MFVQNTVWAKICCLTVCNRNCVRVIVSVNECTPQLADSTEFVRVGCAWLRSGVPLKVFHVWDFPAVSTAQQHTCCSGAQWLCLLLHSNSANTKCFIYVVATTTQQHNGYSRELYVCCIVHFYQISSQIH